MSNNTNLQTHMSNPLHNARMEFGGNGLPLMLTTGSYIQWRSRFIRFINTKPNHKELHHCLENETYVFGYAEPDNTTGDDGAAQPRERVMETYDIMSAEKRKLIDAEAKLVNMILTGIDNDIYSTVDACDNAKEMWTAIQRLKQGELINVQDLETNLFWEFGKFTAQDGESIDSYYSRFYKMMNELVRNKCTITNHQVNVQFLLQLKPEWQRFVTMVKQSQNLKTVSYHKLYDILKQHQNQVNEIRAKRAKRAERNTNSLALVAATSQQLVSHRQQQPSHYTPILSTRSQAATRNKGKEIAHTPSPTYDTEPEEVIDDEETSRDKEIERLMALITTTYKKIYKPTNNNLRSSSNTRNKQVENTSRYNRQTAKYDNQRVANVAGARENVGTQVVQ
ncbi:hypothetical protein Tco_1282922 [Tanacetum coccineum]